MTIARSIVYCGRPAIVVCDANCGKAWGINGRPRIDFSGGPDDYAFLADDELGEAPDDPGTYEGGHAKPRTPDQRLNKWCVRECERSRMSRPGKASDVTETRDMSRRSYNQPWKHAEGSCAPAPAGEAAEGGT